jgi:hypothetical protein
LREEKITTLDNVLRAATIDPLVDKRVRDWLGRLLADGEQHAEEKSEKNEMTS